MEKMALALVVLMCGFAAVLVVFGCFLVYYACWNHCHKKHRKKYQQHQKNIDQVALGMAEDNELFNGEKKKKDKNIYMYFTASGLRDKVNKEEEIEMNPMGST